MTDHLNEEKLLNIMDESFLSQLVWDDNGTAMDVSNNNNNSNQPKTVKPDSKTTGQVSSRPTEPILITPKQSEIKPALQKIVPAPVTQQYQHIKPAPAPPHHLKNTQKTPKSMILTQNRSNIITSAPSIIVQNSNYFNLKTIAPATQQTNLNIKSSKPQLIQQATPITSNTQSMPVMQQVLTFQTTDKQQVLLATSNQPTTVVYTTAANDQRTVSFETLLFR